MMWILINTPGPTGVEGAGGSGGPGRGAGGWRQGQGGPRDRPLRAVRLACGDLAGGPPPTGTHSGPAHQGRPPAPGTPAGPQASTRGADGSRAGRRPPAHTATRQNQVDHAQWMAGVPSEARGADGERVGCRPRAHKVARPNKTEDPATGSLATRAAAEQCTGCTAIGTAADQRKTPAQPPAFTASQQHSQKSYEKYESFIGSS